MPARLQSSNRGAAAPAIMTGQRKTRDWDKTRSKYAKMLAQIDAIVLQCRSRGDDGDTAGIENDDIVGDVEDEFRTLLDQNDRKAAFLQLADGGHHFCHNLRREAF